MSVKKAVDQNKPVLTEDETKSVKSILPGNLVNDYNALDVHDKKAVRQAEKFKSKMDDEIDRILSDDMYDERQKKVMITRAIDEHAETHKQEIINSVASYNKKSKEVQDYLNQAINVAERMKPEEQKEWEIASKDMEGETKTELMMATKTDDVEKAFSQAVDQAKYNKYKARFLTKNAYLYLERLQSLSKDDKELNRRVNGIKRKMKDAEKYAYTPGQTGIRKMLDRSAYFQRTGLDGKRLIDHYKKGYLKQLQKREQQMAKNG